MRCFMDAAFRIAALVVQSFVKATCLRWFQHYHVVRHEPTTWPAFSKGCKPNSHGANGSGCCDKDGVVHGLGM